MTRVVLFEWTAGGHRPVYVRRFVETLRPSAEVVLVLPQVTLDAIGDLGVETRSIGEPRPKAIGRRLGWKGAEGAVLARDFNIHSVP